MAEGLQLGPEEVAALRAALMAAEARDAVEEARVSDDTTLIAHLKLEIAKLRRGRFGQNSECSARLPDQLEELEGWRRRPPTRSRPRPWPPRQRD